VSSAVIDVEIALRNYFESLYVKHPDEGHEFYKNCLKNRSESYCNNLFKNTKNNYYKLLLFMLLCKKIKYVGYDCLDYLNLELVCKNYIKQKLVFR